MMVCLLPEGKRSGRSTAEQMTEFVVPSKSQGDWIDLVGVELMFEDGSRIQETVS